MKKYFLLHFMVLLGLLLFCSCKKDPEVNMARFEIAQEKVLADAVSVKITGAYSYPGKIDGMLLKIGREESLLDADCHDIQINDKNFLVSVDGLTPGTKYYYCYSVDYGASKDWVTETKDFTTLTQAPTVETVEVLSIDTTTVRVKCKVVSDGGVAITERGICWNTYGDPTLDDETMTNGEGLGEYSCFLSDLEMSTTYFVRAYAKNETGVGFGEIFEFKTAAPVVLPSVSTVEITNVTATSAVCVGNVSSDGGAEVFERGACWSTSQNPTVSGNHANSGTGTGSYTIAMSGLSANTTYHVRTYAINSKGVSYGEDKTFQTTIGLPSVTTSSVTEITSVSAKCGGNVTDQGASNVTERGICWSTSHNPTTADSHINNGTGVGNFVCQMTGLTPNKTYYVRAYARNAQGTGYGEEVSFTALEGLPVVTTNDVTEITSNSAKCGGNVTNQGGSAVVEKGICWSTSHTPTINDTHVSGGSGTGSYTCSMTNLTNGATYYVRAYAKNNQGVSYGAEKEFSTTVGKPTVTTNSVTNITQNSATGGGNVTNDGGATVTERGICWSTSQNPTISSSHVANGTGTGSFTCQMAGLTAGTRYYVRAYATNSAGTSYGSQVDFTTTANLPTVTTAQVSNITQTTALGGGNVTNDGGSTVTERGICWSTSHNPTTSGSHATSGTGTGSFTANMTGLTANTTYYVRAYAKNSQGTAYGSEVSFTTSQNISAPTVTTSQVTNITQTTATGGGNVTSDGGASVTERGICWSTSHNPTTSGSHATSGTGTGSFTANMTGLTANTTYYVRAYAKNSQGTAYGSEVSFTTINSPQAPTGAINGLFTINDNGDQVWFSKGNLQYQASTNTWKFADHQWDYVGESNANISSSYSGWIDLFGWGTSGYDHGAICYQPWSTSENGDDYYAYGDGNYCLFYQTGEADWGYNAISNGGNTENQWRTLSGGGWTVCEWYFLFKVRSTASGIRYAKARVNNVNGIILVPDNWSASTYTLSSTNAENADFSSNVISSTVWNNTLEPAGCVFFPAGGKRCGILIYDVGSTGIYWSSWGGSYNYTAYCISFDNAYFNNGYGLGRWVGSSVRLVQDYNP